MTPDERKQPENEELVNLNADDLDAGNLDEQALEDVAGGQSCILSIECGVYDPN